MTHSFISDRGITARKLVTNFHEISVPVNLGRGDDPAYRPGIIFLKQNVQRVWGTGVPNGAKLQSPWPGLGAKPQKPNNTSDFSANSKSKLRTLQQNQ